MPPRKSRGVSRFTSATFILTSHAFGFARISGAVPNSQFQPAVLGFGWNVNSVYDNQIVSCAPPNGGGYPCGPNRRGDPTMPTGASHDQWTVNISNSAPSSGVSVMLQSSDSTMASVPASVTIPSGQKSAPFQVLRGSQSWGALVNITATIGPSSRTNSISTINSADFPQVAAFRSVLAM
jgi:hypothetical protein